MTSHYWDDLTRGKSPHLSYPLWRHYCDALHASLLHEWIGGRRFSLALKTDLFDEACGVGVVPAVARFAQILVGIDIAESIVEQASRRYPYLEAHVEDVRDLSYPANSFDLIFSNSTLDHFSQPDELQQAVHELVRVLRDGGLLLLTLDNPLHPVIAIRNQVSRFWSGQNALLPYQMGHTLSLRQMVHLLESCHCQILRRSHLLHIPRVLFLHLSRNVDPSTCLGRQMVASMLAFEGLQSLPTSPLTGHFAAILAVKR